VLSAAAGAGRVTRAAVLARAGENLESHDITSFRGTSCAGFGIAARAAAETVEHRGQVFAQVLEPVDVGVKLDETAVQQITGGGAGTLPGVADLEQVADVVQSEAESLAALDESEPVDGFRWVAAMVLLSLVGLAAGQRARCSGWCLGRLLPAPQARRHSCQVRQPPWWSCNQARTWTQVPVSRPVSLHACGVRLNPAAGWHV
jgi:hypothetical protein